MTIQLKHPICITYRRAPTSKDHVATTNHICFILAHGQDVLITCKPYSRPREPSTRQPRATSGHLTHGEKFLTKMQNSTWQQLAIQTQV